MQMQFFQRLYGFEKVEWEEAYYKNLSLEFWSGFYLVSS